MPAAGLGQRAQGRFIEPWHHDSARRIVQVAARAVRQGRALRRSDAQHRHRVALALEIPGRIERLPVLVTVGDQQDLSAPGARLRQQFSGLAQAQVGAATLHRHQAGFERLEQFGDGAGIMGQGRNHEGIAGEGHQADLSLTATPEHVLDLVAGALQARGLEVGRFHGTRQVQHHDTRLLGAKHRLRLLLPHRVGERDDREQPARREQPQRQAAVGPVRADQQVGQQIGIADPAPGAVDRTGFAHPPDQQRQGQQGQKPLRLQEMKRFRHDAPRCSRRGAADRWRPAPAAP